MSNTQTPNFCVYKKEKNAGCISNTLHTGRFKVLTEVLTNIQVYWDVMALGLVNGY
jgi:hypothetical protein